MAGRSLSKRDCVSDCVVPSCSSISCSTGETCILSSQTCSACPSVSCVSLSLTTSTGSSSSALPKGAIAGIVIATLILLVCLSVLSRKLVKRRRVIREISEKAVEHSVQETIHFEEMQGPSYSGGGGRFPSMASIQIGFEPEKGGTMAALAARGASPLPSPDDHFFSADDLTRMSLTESIDTVESKMDSSKLSIAGDGGAAIMQANNPVLAVRAKAAVMQYTKRQSIDAMSALQNACSTSLSREPSLARGAQRVLPAQQVSQSVWEEESVTSSPIERELISPERFAFSRTNSKDLSSRSSRQKEAHTTPTKSREAGVGVTQSAFDVSPESCRQERTEPPRIASQLFSASSLPRDGVTLTTPDKYDWFDPSLLGNGQQE